MQDQEIDRDCITAPRSCRTFLVAHVRRATTLARRGCV